MEVFIIGSGNVAYHLAKAMTKSDIALSGLYSRNEENGTEISKKLSIPFFNNLKSIPKTSDVYLLCVSDDAIKNVANQLPGSIKKSKIVAHTSGSALMKDSLESCKNGGVFYPLQTFTKGKKMTYKTIPFCINGMNPKIIKKLSLLAGSISNSVNVIDDEQRKSIHLSAVMINNFVNHLIYLSEELLKKNEIDPDILQPLLIETIKKQKSLGAFKSQTGPARRKDSETMSAHLDLLRRNKEYRAIYMTISKSIQKTYKSEE